MEQGLSICRRDLYKDLRNERVSINFTNVSTNILQRFDRTEPPLEDRATFQNTVSRFCSEFSERWQRCSRHEEHFLVKNSKWLDNPLNLPLSILKGEQKRNCGRPQKSFQECSDRAKRLKTDDLVSRSLEELAFATGRVMRSAGHKSTADILDQVTKASPSEIKMFQTKLNTNDVEKISEDKALALIVDGKMGRSTYLKVKSCTESSGLKVYPSYDNIQKAKSRCYPEKSTVTITDESAEVTLQSLLDHTTKRIFEVQQEVLNTLPNEMEFEMDYKWGLDGSSNHAEFKKASQNEEFSDSSIILITVVPLQGRVKDNSHGGKGGKIIWQNNRPCSTRFVRPLKFLLKKENVEAVQTETKKVNNQIESLSPTIISGKVVHHKMSMTMIDGKIHHILSDTKSHQVCNVCGLKPSSMNIWSEVNSKCPNEEMYKFGIPVLHAKIRAFECIKNISYRQDFCEYFVKTPEQKLVFSARQSIVQKAFRTKMGLHVDKPRSGGVGNSNDGNTARRAFAVPHLFSEICNVDEKLIRMIANILNVIACGYAIDVNAFRMYCHETWVLYVKFYEWYWMPSSLHKLLIHGWAIIAAAPLPIGSLSEESQESRNKDLRYIRMHNTRKVSWKACHEDLLNALFISSDPVISSLRELPPKTTENFNSEALKLLSNPHH